MKQTLSDTLNTATRALCFAKGPCVLGQEFLVQVVVTLELDLLAKTIDLGTTMSRNPW